MERVHRICSKVNFKPRSRVIVATDDRRIESHVRTFGGDVQMTRRDHPSGTDRVAEVARKHSCDVIINVQGDEPLLDPQIIRSLALAMEKDPSILMGTLCHGIADLRDYRDPNVVKVTLTDQGNALYFSRSPIPHLRDGEKLTTEAYRHIGIYAYRRSFLLHYVRWPQSSLEKAEKLEQLRALQRGVSIRCLKTNYHAIGVDVPADVKKVERLLKTKRQL